MKLINLLILSACMSQSYGQGILFNSAGNLSGEMNGRRFDIPLRYSSSGNLFTVAAEDEIFFLTLNFNDINSITELKEGIIRIPSAQNKLIITFSDKNLDVPFSITNASMLILDKNSRGITGELEFGALSRFFERGKVYRAQLRNGKFRIDFK